MDSLCAICWSISCAGLKRQNGERICIGSHDYPLIDLSGTWFTFIGATAIDLELRGIAQGAIVNADISAQLFKTINLILSPELAIALSVVVVTLLLTFPGDIG